MAEGKLAGRYAKSLLGLAEERNQHDTVFEDMKLILKTCSESRELSLLLRNPIVNTNKKDSIISSIFKGKISDMSLAFLQIITRKKREYYIEEIAREYINIYKENKGIRTAKIITASPLDEVLKNEVMDFLKKKTNKQIELTEEINKDIIGGYILRWDDEQLDASISKKLRELHHEFRENKYVKEL